ncbi:MAG TPA: Ig-like domain-containing protein, partial [Verrucomicrobiae bacterium]|nr:Ig-like domain-containing protein [Verrucomicrobiae bacterium]
VPFFSNPRIVFNNVPMGVAEGATNACDNARTLSMTAPVVSAFYGPATTTVPPAVGITAPADGATFLSGNNVNITVTALDADTLLKQVEIYTNSTLAAVIPGNLMGTYHLTLPSSPPGDFSLVARALDNLGAASATLPLTFSVRPDNDNAAQAILLQGTSVTVTGSNRAATLEAGEPKHTGNPGGRSVWYSWTAPRSGSVDVVATGVSVYPLADVYLAGPLATRVSVAQGIHFTSGAFVETTYFNTVAGQNYWIAVDSLGGVGDDFTLQMIYAPLPANDDYQNATVVAGQSFSVSGSNVGATTEPGETQHANNPSNKTVWYAWTAPRDGTVNLTSVSSSFFPLSDVYLGATLATATNAPDIFHHFDTTNLTESSHFEAHAGVTYQIVVGGVKDSQGAFTLSLAYDPAPANDLFANRQSITGSVIHLTGTVAGASFESGEPQHDDNPGGHSVWYAWVAPVSGTVTVKVDGSQFFPLVDVYTGTIVNGLARVLTAVSFDNTNLVTTAVFAAVAGRAYALAVDGYSGLTGPFALELTTANIPATLQPVQADVSSGKFGFTFGGNPGSPFVVQASADLVNWITVTQGTVGAEPFHFSEALLPGPHTRFFRVRPAP